MNETGNYCAHGECQGVGYVELFDYCPQCWLNELTAEEREILRDDFEDAPEVSREVHEHHHTTINPPVSRWLTLAISLIGGIAGGSAISAWWWFGGYR